MLIRVGSVNPTKVAAVEEYFCDVDLSFPIMVDRRNRFYVCR